MSIDRMSAVWKHSKARGSHLLLLLAIADHAADDGYAWPGMTSLAKKVRMSRRHVIRMIEAIEKTGELHVERNNDHEVNKYIVKIGLTQQEFAQTLKIKLKKSNAEIEAILRGDDNMSPPQDIVDDDPPHDGGGSDRMSLGSDSCVTTLVTHESHESSYNHQLTVIEEEEGDSEMLRKPEPENVPLTDDGDEIPLEFDKHNGFFRTIMGNLLGRPGNLQGRERKDWMDNIQLRAAGDPEFKRWCIWQSENNAKGRTVKTFIDFCMSEGDFAAWKVGQFKAKSELVVPGVSRGTKQKPQKEKSEFDKWAEGICRAAFGESSEEPEPIETISIFGDNE
jgi:DNA-binding MarR family transcriptional regulator